MWALEIEPGSVSEVLAAETRGLKFNLPRFQILNVATSPFELVERSYSGPNHPD